MDPEPRDEVRVCTECGHYMSKKAPEKLENLDDNEFFDLWKCSGCGAKYHAVVGEDQG